MSGISVGNFESIVFSTFYINGLKACTKYTYQLLYSYMFAPTSNMLLRDCIQARFMVCLKELSNRVF